MPAEVSVGGAAGADTRREAHLVRRFHLGGLGATQRPETAQPRRQLGQARAQRRQGRSVAGDDAGHHRRAGPPAVAGGPQDATGGAEPERARRYARVAHEINLSVTGYMVGDLLTAGIVTAAVFIAYQQITAG